ncbi:thiosulfate/3-mercaptopyruvate sulfurtransferase 1, mitochondrial-like [Miscanthus floridulus]|uniref:thiosulfate/3-mercaptopyruvate sulfurtransferase 1, mitochondrial-like n=1 Tax=Miscanthus floridulus TaxID=154761 RepID=UPI00345979D5
MVSAEWLHANLKDPDVKVLDASWYMPAEQRNPLQEYQVAHIPGALFFDVDGISDRTSSLPHMLPSEKAFSAAISALGIYNKDGIVVYDGKGLFNAARVWWMFHVFGHDKVWVLDGGLPQWRASGYDVESSASSDAILKASAAGEAIEKVYQGQSVGPATFEAKLQPHLLWSLDQVKENINTQTHQLIDARSKPRSSVYSLCLYPYRRNENIAHVFLPHLVATGLHPHHRWHHRPVAEPPIGRIGRSSAEASLPPPRLALSSVGSRSLTTSALAGLLPCQHQPSGVREVCAPRRGLP